MRADRRLYSTRFQRSMAIIRFKKSNPYGMVNREKHIGARNNRLYPLVVMM